MEILLLTILFISVLINYILAIYIFADKKPHRWYLAVIVLCICMVIIILRVREDSLRRLLVQIFAFLSFMLMYKCKDAGKAVLVFVVLAALSSINNYFLLIVIPKVIEVSQGEVLFSIFEQIMILILLLAAFFLQKRFSYVQKGDKEVNFKYIYVVAMVISAIVLSVSLGSLNVLQQYVYKDIHRIIISIIGILSYFALIAIVLVIISFRRLNQRLRELLSREKELRVMQMRYYDSMRDKVEETAKYRHDLFNHLIVLRQLASCKDVEKIESYLQEMEEGIDRIQRITVNTGNELLDILCTYFFARWREQLAVQTIGRVSKDINISEYDLCTIFANLFQNIDDEARRNPENCTWVRLEIYQGEEYIQFVIKNSRKECKLTDGKTSKADRENHGFGLANVRETVSKNHGFFEVCESSEEYVVKVSLPTK